MDKKKGLLIIGALFVLLMAGAYVLYDRLGGQLAPDQLAVQTQPPEATEATEPIPMAPDFTVCDLEGREVRLSDYLGKPVVLNFWASWCGPCKMEMPEFQEKYEELGEKVQFLLVNMTDGSRETLETASGFVAESGYTFPVLYDTASDAAYTYGVYSLPTTYFIDAEGHAIAVANGAIDGDTLQRGIDMILP